MLFTDNADPAKRKIVVQSVDPGIALAEAINPAVLGAFIHVYSDTDDFCGVIPLSAADGKLKKGQWKYKLEGSKNSASIKDGKLTFKIGQGVTYTLADDGSQGPVNAQVPFGGGSRYCLRCAGNKNNDGKKFSARKCVAATCDPEPSICPPPPTTTSTTPTTTTTGGG